MTKEEHNKRPHPNFFVNIEGHVKTRILAFVGAIGSWAVILPQITVHFSKFGYTTTDLFKHFIFIYVFFPGLLLVIWLLLTGRMHSRELNKLQRFTIGVPVINIKQPLIVFLLFYFIVGGLVVFSPNCSNTPGKGNHDVLSLDYADKLTGYYEGVENSVGNLADRYAIKSKMSLELYKSLVLNAAYKLPVDYEPKSKKNKLDSIVHLITLVANSYENRKLWVNNHLNYLTAQVLEDSLTRKNLVNYGGSDSITKLFFNREVLENLFINASLALDYIPVINHTLNDMLKADNSAHLGFSQLVTEDHILIGGKNLPDTVHNEQIVKQAAAAFINFHNSNRLHIWIEDYRAHCQRKIQFELNKTKDEVLAIWKHYSSIARWGFGVLLLVFGIVYVLLLVEKSKYIKSSVFLEHGLRHIDHYIFPLSVFVSVICFLWLGSMQEPSKDTIQFTTPSWFVNSPSWNLKASAEHVVSGSISNVQNIVDNSKNHVDNSQLHDYSVRGSYNQGLWLQYHLEMHPNEKKECSESTLLPEIKQILKDTERNVDSLHDFFLQNKK